MSTRTDLLTAARALLTGIAAVPAAKLVNSGAKGPRPVKPYVTVKLMSAGGGTLGPAERIDSVTAGAPVVKMREHREATVSVQGFGVESEAWLDALQLGLGSPAALLLQEEAGVSAVLLAPTRDMSEMLDTAEEARFLLELTLRYRVDSAAAAAVELLTAGLDGDASGGPSTFPTDSTLSL